MAEGAPSCTAGDHSIVSVVFELWLVLRSFAPKFPALVSFYYDSVGRLSRGELEELVERQAVSFFLAV